MKTANTSVDVDSLAELLGQQYGEADPQLSFVPVGADSWCYRTDSLWISVRRDRQGHVPEAYEAAAELGEQGLGFVLAPLRGVDRRVVHEVDDRPVVVSPVVDGRPLHATTKDEFDALGSLITRLHLASVKVELPREDYQLPFESELHQGIATAMTDDTSKGPYGKRIRELIHANHGHLEASHDELLQLASECRRDEAPLVLTHGEPNGNAVQATDGRLLLLDWGTAAMGPPERDWWDFTYLDADAVVRSGFRRFYELRFVLSEVAEYTARFVKDHAGDQDDDRMWRDLCRYVDMANPSN
jgi:spectinomycin phosphotransferase